MSDGGDVRSRMRRQCIRRPGRCRATLPDAVHEPSATAVHSPELRAIRDVDFMPSQDASTYVCGAQAFAIISGTSGYQVVDVTGGPVSNRAVHLTSASDRWLPVVHRAFFIPFHCFSFSCAPFRTKRYEAFAGVPPTVGENAKEQAVA